MKKKLLSMLLATTMVVGMLTGCGATDEATTDKESKVEQDAQGSDSQQASGETEKEVVDLRLIFYGDMTTRREEFFKNEFHDAVLEDLSIDLTVETLPWGADSQIATMLASGESFACYNIVSAFDWPSKGYLAKIDMDLIEEHCPNLIAARGETNGFECVKYQGDIYAIPFGNKPYSGGLQMFSVRNDLLKKIGYEASEITTYDELMEMLEVAHAAYPDMRVSRGVDLRSALAPELTDAVAVWSGVSYAYVNSAEEGDKVYSYYESEWFEKACKETEKWVQLGYIGSDILTNPTQEIADWEAGNCLMMYGMPGALISTSLQAVVPDAEESLICLDGITKVKANDYDWGISISASDQDKVDRWLSLFDWMYQDQEHYNFCVYGVEGKDWEYNEDGTINRICKDSFIDSWFMEAIPYNNYSPSISEENVERYMTWDEGSILAKNSGFSFDSTPVSAELAMMTAVYTEYIQPLEVGLVSYDENYEEAIAALKEAGLDAYMAEYQKQFSEWYANK